MTDKEWATETLSPERLAQLKIAAGRYGVMDGAKSIVGATPEAGVITQYKTWALPILGTTLRNVRNLGLLLGKDKTLGKKSLTELLRTVEFLSYVGIIYMMMRPDEEDDSLLGKVKQRAWQELTTLIQALDPVLITSVPRLQSFLKDLGTNISLILKLEQYETSKFGEYEAGELKGLKGLIRMFTPRAIKQFETEKEKTGKDVAKEILSEIKAGTLDVAAAKEKFATEMSQIKSKQKQERLKLEPKEYAAEIKTLIKEGALTTEEAKKEFIDYSERNVEKFESPSESSFIDKIQLYAKALGTDPVTAFNFIFQGENIRRIDNGTIIVERMPFEESQKIKKERGAGDLVLDHTIPLQLGGGNSDSNLKLVTVEDWERYTLVENYLGDKLRAGLIEKKEAQELIRKFKNGELTTNEIMESYPTPEKLNQNSAVPLIKKALSDQGINSPKVLAYALATVEHETDGTFEPIEEYRGREQARRLGYSGGEDYFGRGFIQLTGLKNYLDIGQKIGMGDRLAKDPSLALEPETAAKILAVFFKENGVAELAESGNFVKARQPVNGTDKATQIAALAQRYLKAMP